MTRRINRGGISPSADAIAEFERGRRCGVRIPRELSTDIEGGRFSPNTTCEREPGHFEREDPGPTGAAHFHIGASGAVRWSDADYRGDIRAMVRPEAS